MSTPIPHVGTKTLLNRVFFNQFMVKVVYCAAGHQRITRKHEYHHDYVSLFSFAPFDHATETYDERYHLTGLIFFRFCILIADLKKQRF